MKRWPVVVVAAMILNLSAMSSHLVAADSMAVPLIFDTDVGNDIDDALALGLIHALESRGECRLLAVTINKDNELCAPFVDLVNTFYDRGDVPIGVVHGGRTPEDGNYLRPVVEARDGDRPRYPRRLASGRDAPDATDLLRKTLAAAEDSSVVIVAVGFSTNLARLLDSPPDEHSRLGGAELVACKCRLLSMMAGMYAGAERHKEYNVYIDVAAARRVFERWPTPIVASGFEIGQAIKYPAASIERDFNYVAHHPLREAYERYQKMPYDRETWDLTSVLYAVRPRQYFDVSPPGTIEVDSQDITQFRPGEGGKHRYLVLNAEQTAGIRNVFVDLVSSRPARLRQ